MASRRAPARRLAAALFATVIGLVATVWSAETASACGGPCPTSTTKKPRPSTTSTTKKPRPGTTISHATTTPPVPTAPPPTGPPPTGPATTVSVGPGTTQAVGATTSSPTSSTGVTVLGTVITPAQGELPRTGSGVADLLGVALIGVGLGLGVHAVHGWSRRARAG